jgi:hypothetical protein
MRSSSLVALLRRATTLSNSKTEGGGKTRQRRKAKLPPAGEDKAKDRVEARAPGRGN